MSIPKLLQVTERAWIVKRDDTLVGILNKDMQDRFVYTSGKTSWSFDTDYQVEEHFNNSRLFSNSEQAISIAEPRVFVKGYEIFQEDPELIDDDDPRAVNGLPLYLKKPGSNIIYAAGYYAVLFSRGWTRGYHPKLSTLLTYGYEGPWRTKEEAQARIKQLNKQLR
jgi:hypothetical protein